MQNGYPESSCSSQAAQTLLPPPKKHLAIEDSRDSERRGGKFSGELSKSHPVIRLRPRSVKELLKKQPMQETKGLDKAMVPIVTFLGSSSCISSKKAPARICIPTQADLDLSPIVPSFESPTDLDDLQKRGGHLFASRWRVFSARTMDACWPGKSWMSKCGNSKDVMSNVMPLSHTWIGNGDSCSKPGLVTRQARNSCRW